MRAGRLVCVFLCVAGAAAAHPGEPLQPDDLWGAWEFDPGVVIPLLIGAVLYALGERRQQSGPTLLHRTAFWTGWGSLVVALVSPLHRLGEVLFSAHMVQHEILMLISAPLLILARPLVTLLWALPMETRRTLGRWSKQKIIASSWVVLTAPLFAWLIHAAAIWVWHAPDLFQLTLTSDVAHTAQHLSFFVSALLFWWAAFSSHGRRAYGAAFLYVFTTALHSGILGALLTFSPRIWYSAYAKTTQAWGLTPLEDQQIGGLIMWVPASIVYLVTGLMLVGAWIKESDLRVERLSSVN